MTFQQYHQEIINISSELGSQLKKYSLVLTTAESCTGGLLASYLTSNAGSSAYFNQSWVTYSNESKMKALNVSQASLDTFGAVSVEVAKEMATGALVNSNSNIAISITGIAGPDGGTVDKPVGTVCFGFRLQNSEKPTLSACLTEKIQFNGDRESVRLQACLYALKYILDKIKNLG